MQLAEIIGLAVLVAVLLAIVGIAVRRRAITRAGGFDVSWRTRGWDSDRGWILGQARYRGTALCLYRSFSPLPGAAIVLNRTRLVLLGHRELTGPEVDLLPIGAVVVRCAHGGTTLEIALARDALTGLRSWIESRPPGSRAPQTGSVDDACQG